MNRKDKTVKQLQAECRKRKVGFMMNWTKAALIKRLEDEDKRELASKEVEDKASKEIDKAKEELESVKNKHDNTMSRMEESLKHLQVKAYGASEELKKSDPEVIKKQITEQMIKDQKSSLHLLKQKLAGRQKDQQGLLEKSNLMANECVELAKEIQALEFSIANLK